MNRLDNKTISANRKTVNKKWILINAYEKILGRLASQIAFLLRGKHKINFTPHVDCGDNVIVINASKIKLTGNKLENKKYIWHTGYPGGQKKITAKNLLNRKPLFLLKHAIKGMLPKNRLGKVLLSNLYLYEGEKYKQVAQTPQTITIK